MRHPVLLKPYQGVLPIQENRKVPERQLPLAGQRILELQVVHVLPEIPKVRESREALSSHEDLAAQLALENLSTYTQLIAVN